MLNAWAIVLIIWSLYRVYFRTDLPIWFDEFIAKPLIFLVPLHYYITKVEKKNFLESLDLHTKNWRSGIIVGTIAGLIFLAVGFVVMMLRQNSSPIGDVLSSPSSVLYFILIAFATSISEEILSRGFVLKRLYEDSKNMFSAVFYSSVLFFFLHIPMLATNPAFHGGVLLQVMVTDLLLSFAVSFLYLQKRSLFVPIMIHAFYAISIYFFL